MRGFMVLSKTKINKRMNMKTNSVLVQTIFLAKKINQELASALSVPTRKQAKVNVGKLNQAKSELVFVPGKVLSSGEITKKMKVYALGFSKIAKEKLKKAGCEFDTIINVLKKVKKGEKLKGEIIN
jgi:large subunit ribosomal protein L18e